MSEIKVDPKDLLSCGQVAKLVGVTSRTVQNWIKRGEIPYISLPGGHYRIHRSVVKLIMTPHFRRN